jgi:acyl-CoA synthetase (AMP-forming)/AMP-acid ligase II
VDRKLTEDDIKTFLGKRLARYKAADKVEFVDKIPRNAAGKILRRVLRDTVVARPTSPAKGAVSVYTNVLEDMRD